MRTNFFLFGIFLFLFCLKINSSDCNNYFYRYEQDSLEGFVERDFLKIIPSFSDLRMIKNFNITYQKDYKEIKILQIKISKLFPNFSTQTYSIEPEKNLITFRTK